MRFNSFSRPGTPVTLPVPIASRMNTKALYLIFLLLFFSFSSKTYCQNQKLPKDLVKVQAQGFKDPKGNPYLVLSFINHPGWHTYWVNAGDSGDTLHLKWDLPAGFTDQGITAMSLPKRIPYGPFVNFGFKDRAIFVAELKVDENAALGLARSVRCCCTRSATAQSAFRFRRAGRGLKVA